MNKPINYKWLKISALILCLAFVVPSLSCGGEARFLAYDTPFNTGNQTEIDGNITLFNHTFENELAGAMPDMGWWGLNPTVFSSTAYSTGDSHGIVMRNNMSGANSGVVSIFAVGHTILGKYSVSWDYYVDEFSSNIGTYETSTVCLLDTNSHLSTYRWASVTLGATKITFNNVITFIQKDTWYHVELMVDTTELSATVLVNGAVLSSISLPAARALSHMAIINSMPSAGKYMQYCYDNIEIKIPSHVLQPYATNETRTAISLGFDDAHGTVYDEGIDALQGLPAYIAVTTNFVGTPDYMTWQELQECHDNGWELLSHSVSHPMFDQLTLTQAENELIESKSSIEENITGADVTGFAWPNSVHPESMWDMAWDQYNYLLSVNWNYDSNRYSFDRYTGNSVVFRSRLFMNLPAAVYGNYGYLNIFSHQVTDNTSIQYGVGIGDLTDFATRLIENNSCVLTPNNYYEHYRNSHTAAINGNQTSFEINYDKSYGNWINDELILEIKDHRLSSGDYVLMRNGVYYTEFSVLLNTTPLKLTVEEGMYDVITLTEYRNQIMNAAISPIFAIIPLVIIVSVIPMVMGLGRKLK